MPYRLIDTSHPAFAVPRAIAARAWSRAEGIRRPVPTDIQLVLLFLALRLFTAVLGFLSNVVFPNARTSQFTVFGQPNVFWDAMARHDSGWYRSIARFGYEYIPDAPNSLGFFPLYPMIVRFVGSGFGGWKGSYYLAGIVVAWVAFLASAPVLYRLARLDLDDASARRSLLLLVVFPFAFFFGVVYSESLYLLLAVSAFYGARTKRWWVVALAGGLAATTRVNGILLVPSLAWIAWVSTKADWAARVRAGVSLAAIPLGVAVYSAYVYWLSGDPFEWYQTITRWDYHPGGPPWAPLLALTRQLVRRPYEFLTVDPNGPFDTLNGVTALIVLGTIPFVWKRLGAAYGLFMLLNLWLPLSSGEFEGLGRYCTVLFPMFFWLGRCENHAFTAGCIVVFSCFYTLCLALFANIYPLF